jgi:hypothetical protein
MLTNETREPATAFSCRTNSKNLLDDEVLQDGAVSGYTMRVLPAARQTESLKYPAGFMFTAPDVQRR